MNPDNLIQVAQKGLRVTLGATASLLETLQDPQRREASLSRLRTEFSQLAEEWEVKGETTEREARSFVDGMFGQAVSRSNQPSAGESRSEPFSSPSTSSTQNLAIQQDLQDLTTQLAEIRTELEKLREQKDS